MSGRLHMRIKKKLRISYAHISGCRLGIGNKLQDLLSGGFFTDISPQKRLQD